MPSMTDTTGVNPALAPDTSSDDDDNFGLDTSLLDATGQTQILSDDFAVETMGFDATQVLGDNESTLLAGDLDDDEELGRLPDDAETLLAPLDDEGDFDFAKTEALPKDVFTNDPSSDETGELPSFTGSTDLDLDLDDLTAALRVSEVGDTINQVRDDATVEQPRIRRGDLDLDVGDAAGDDDWPTQALSPDDVSEDLQNARTMTEVGTKLDLARAYVDMGDPGGARSILEEVLDEGDHGQRQQAQQLLDSLPS
jgi:pilus assembly protein FimV